jgi:molybdopterin-containing oxidoreductase family membrane subunit
MWFGRFNIVVTSLSRDYLPSSWASYSPTYVEVGFFIGTLGMFITGVLLFFRYIPMIAISELKSVAKFDKPHKNHVKHNAHE